MARSSQNQAKQGSLYFAKITGTKEGEKVHFQLTAPDPNGKGTVTSSKETRLSGYLVGAQHRQWSYQDRMIDSVVLTLNDPGSGDDGETYRIEFSVTSGLSRGILNSLLSADNFLPMLSISLYNSKEGGYANAWVTLGGDQLKWKYGKDQLDKHISVTTEKVKDSSGKLVTKQRKNYLELNEFLLSEFKNNVIPKVGKAPVKHVEESSHESTQPAVVIVGDNDLPF